MKNSRIYYYDFLKALAIYLVCFYHFGALDIDLIKTNQYHVYLNYFIYSISSIGVPIFFMVNGSLLLNREYEIKKHVYKTILLGLLYLIWGTVTIVLLAPKFGDHYSLTQFIKSVYYTKELRTTHLWFLIALIYIYLLFPLLKAVFDKDDTKIILYVTGMITIFTFGINLLNFLINIIGYLLNTNSIKFINLDKFIWFNPFDFIYSYSLVYFILGGLIVRKMKSINLKDTTCGVIFLLSWLLLFLFGLSKTNMNKEIYDTVWNGYGTIMTLLMSISTFILCSRIRIDNVKFKKMISTISTNTLGIYFVHIPIGFWLSNYFEKLPISKYLVFDLFYALIILVLSLVVTLVIKRIPIISKLVKI